METQRIQSEFEYHRKIRNTYFHLFNDVDLPQESYVKNWSFEKRTKIRSDGAMKCSDWTIVSDLLTSER